MPSCGVVAVAGLLRPPLQLQLVAVAGPLDPLQVSPDLYAEGRLPAHEILDQSTTANLRKVPHDFIQVGSRHS